ncbi:hypothetical protein MCUN1_001961 [Malassezia cuniculi]|uniref:Metallo-beta-lactamase domain-containing protein n=1 Tax=Malassezia cuniculi TaxID=948313 RepID=A0AAF0J636_9BASI|nr:hypothetical protein MCUN1_001961 [Malassezia cuniculi]
MKITPVPVRQDNYAYILQSTPTKGRSQAVFVDVFDVPKVLSTAHSLGLEDSDIVGLITTHGHHDHAGGNETFAERFANVPIYGGKGVKSVTNVISDGDKFTLFGDSGAAVQVTGLATPCHTRDSICFFVEDERSESDLANVGAGIQEGAAGEKKRGVFTGDTLFISGCGRFFEGNAEEMHQYTRSNVKFSLSVMPGRQAIHALADDVERGRNGGVTTGIYSIYEEQKHNPFMLVSDPEVQDAVSGTNEIDTMTLPMLVARFASALRAAPLRTSFATRGFARSAPTFVKLWEHAPRVPVAEGDMPMNPGDNPPVEKIGVNAVLRRNPDSMDKHTTTIFAEFSLWNKTAVLTGGNRGLGLEMALAYVEAGAHVYVIDLPPEPCEDFQIVADHCQKLDRQIEYISADVTSETEMNEAMRLVRDHTDTGSIDICVANAGIMQTYPALEYPIDKFRKMLDVNTIGAFITAQAAARIMAENPVGTPASIILIASMSGTVVNRDQQWVAYNTSKSAVLQLGRNLAAEFGPHNIRVNTISPGYIRTNLVADQLDSDPEMLRRWSTANPLGRIGMPHELRGVAVWLASNASSFCNGADIIVSGGHTIW